MIFPKYLRNLLVLSVMIFQFSKRQKDDICLAWHTMFNEYGKVLVLNFSEMGNKVFFDPKNSCKDDI